MKKTIFAIIALLTLSHFAYAEKQYIKYSLSDGEITSIGATPDIQAGAGEEVSIADVEFPKDPIANYKFDRKKMSIVRKDEAVIQKAEVIRNFNVGLLTQRLGQAFTGGDAIDLAPYLAALQSYAIARNFTAINAFGLGLVAKEKATQKQVETIFALFLEQGIDLSKY